MLRRPAGTLDVAATGHQTRGPGLWADVSQYLLQSPPLPTRVPLRRQDDRENYDLRILQRIGVNVADYSVLSIHRIGIDAPLTLVWEELSRWRPDGGYWPNTLARVVGRDSRFEHADVYLLGRMQSLFVLRNGFLGLDFIPLFSLDLLKRQSRPRVDDVDNARYFLYRCSGGYPIGVFAIYVRSGIPSQQESEPAQVFFVVSFDFFGRKEWMAARALRPVWASLHDRVTAHFLYRFKTHCEQQFRRLQRGEFEPV
jgi:hypothetical protein